MLAAKDRNFLATNLKGLFQDMLEWMEDRNAELRRGGEFDGTPAEAKLFAALRGRERAMADLARVLGVSRQAVHHTVQRLANHGLVEVVPSPHSGREKLVRITPRGRELQKLAAANLRHIERELGESIGKANVELLRRLLTEHLTRVGRSPDARSL